MPKTVQSFDWSVCDDRKPLPACVGTIVALAVDTPVTINIDNISVRDVSIPVEWVLIDNYANGTTQTLNMGPLTKVVGAYNRSLYRVPKQARALTLTLTGDVNVIVSNVPDFLEAAADEIAIQQAADQFVSYTWITISAGRGQVQATDQNKNIQLTNAGASVYSLLSAVAMPNGYYNPMIKNVGAGRWSITPVAGQTINTDWTNGSPLQLSTRDHIELSGDGAQWIAKGRISFESAQQAYPAAGGLVTVAHGLVRKPTEYELVLQCVGAEFNYSIGDEIKVPINAGDTARAMIGSMYADTTNLYFRYNSGSVPASIANKTTGALSTATTGNWRIVMRAWIDL